MENETKGAVERHCPFCGHLMWIDDTAKAPLIEEQKELFKKYWDKIMEEFKKKKQNDIISEREEYNKFEVFYDDRKNVLPISSYNLRIFDLEKKQEVSNITELVLKFIAGSNKPIIISMTRLCSECSGRGSHDIESEKCYTCNGKGVYKEL